MHTEETRALVTIELGADAERPEWVERLFALGEFLLEDEAKKKDQPEEKVSIVAYEDERIGGLRLAEVDFTIERKNGDMAGVSYMRESHDEFIFLAEMFLETHGIKPYRPDGWESCINDHGEARIALLRCMGRKEAADREYQKQLEEEKDIPTEPDWDTE